VDDNTDRAMEDLFAEAYAGPVAGEVFVAKVMGQIARRRRMRTAMGAGIAAALFVGASFFAMPLVTASTEVVASLPSSPIGLIASLPIGILLLTLSALRLTDLNA
jgi:hypothetical protein